MEPMLLILFLMAMFTPADLYRSLPAEVKGWKASGEDMVFDRETLYHHIDGGAELYLTYDFREVLVRRFEHPAKPGMLLEVYDMGSAPEAFGIFSCERDGDPLDIGQGAEYAGGLLRLWKDRFFVAITSLGPEARTRDAIRALGKTVADMIASSGSPPALLGALPADGLDPASVRYFHAAQSLNNIYFLANENILHLGRDTDCVFARYDTGEAGCYLLLVRYPAGEQALGAHRSVLNDYMPEGAETGFVQVEDSTWTGLKQSGRYLAMVFESPDVETATRILTGVNIDD